jgi:lipoprotein signal peptidase
MYRIAALAAVIGLAADQGSKWALLELAGVREDRPIRLLPVFDLVLWWNQGTSFSLFRTGAAWGPYIFSLASLAIIAGLVLWLSFIGKPVLAAAIGAVIGGALGNVVDRLRFGAVADFFYAHMVENSAACARFTDWFGTCGWPAFNVADSLIVVGIGVLVFDGMFLNHKSTDKLVRRERP